MTEQMTTEQRERVMRVTGVMRLQDTAKGAQGIGAIAREMDKRLAEGAEEELNLYELGCLVQGVVHIAQNINKDMEQVLQWYGADAYNGGPNDPAE